MLYAKQERRSAMLYAKQERIIRSNLDSGIESAEKTLRDLESLLYQINEQFARAKQELEKAKDIKSKTLTAFGLDEYS